MNVGGDEIIIEIEMTGLTPEDAVGSRGVPSKAEGRKQLISSRREDGQARRKEKKAHCSGTEASHIPSWESRSLTISAGSVLRR